MKVILSIFVVLSCSVLLHGQNPGDITSSPLLWLKADQGVSTSSGRVSQWLDQSGNGFQAFQNTSSRRPTYVNTGPNGKPTFTFDGGDYLKISSGILGNDIHNDLQIFIVSAPAVQSYNYVLSENCQPQRMQVSLPYSVPWKYEETVFFDAGATMGDARVYGNWAGTYGQYNVWSLQSSFTNSKQSIYKDMVPLSTDNSAVSITGSNQQLFIGGNGTSNRNFKGNISEIIVFDATLNALDQEAVEQYLYQKYGVGLAWINDQFNYLSTYKKDIAGIGQKDAYGVDIQSSKSDHLTVLNPENLEDDEALVFGHDGQIIVDMSSEALPAGFSQRIKREWRFSELGEVGLVDIEMDLVGIADWPVGNFAMLVDDNKSFGDAVTYPLTRRPGTTIFDAFDVSIDDGQYVTVAIQNAYPQVYPISSLDNFTLRGGTPDHHYNYPDRLDAQEWVYWTRSGPNPWNVSEKMNFRIKFPPNYDPQDADGYPMMIYFTGCGAMGRFKCSYALLPDDPRYDSNHHGIALHDDALNKPATDTTAFPGIVFIPQGDFEGWESGINNAQPSATMVAVFNTVEQTLDKWNINRNQIYIHGLSNGGKAVWDMANRRPDLIAAALPMSATAGNNFFPRLGHLPIWHFQGENDSNPPASASRNLNTYWQANGGDLRYTEYPNTGHNTWNPAYLEPDFYSYMRRQDQRNIHVFFDESDITAAGGSIKLGIAPDHLAYEWYRNGDLLTGATSNQLAAIYGGTYKVKWQRFNDEWETSFEIVLTGPEPTNDAPSADAGIDQEITLPINTVALLGTGEDSDGVVVAYQWTQISGPSAATFTLVNNSSTDANGLTAGVYIFRLTVTDDGGEIGSDDVQVTVNSEPVGNSSPTADAGSDQSITLPVNSVTLTGLGSDSDGSIAGYLWTKLTGPGASAINSPASASTTISNLIEGSHTFRLIVTDNEGATGFDDMVVTVFPENLGGAALFRLNVGGTEVIENDMNWEQDKRKSDHEHFTGNSLSTSWNGCGVFSSSNNSTDAPNAVFCPYRRQPSWGDISYSFPLANGSYQLNLYFAERVFSENGVRVFDVNVEGDALLSSFDIYSEVGKNVALQRSFTVNISDGTLDIDLGRIVGDPILNGLEIRTLGGNQSPIVNAGNDQSINLPTSSITLAANASDSDGSIAAIQWSQTSGPNSSAIVPDDQVTTTASGLVQGVYVFEIEVTDDEGSSSTDQVVITVNPEAGNQSPTVDAGADQSITLPQNTVSLSSNASDTDGTIQSYLWYQVSGPNSSLLQPINTATTNASNLIAGSYIFQVEVVDNEGASASDQVAITVNDEPGGTPTVIYRVNAGGTSIADSPMDWSTDKQNSPSPYLTSNKQATTGWNSNNSNNPTDAPGILFGTNRYQPSWGDPVKYEFPVNNGTHDVSLFFAEKSGNSFDPGQRQFAIVVEGNQVLSNYDISASVGNGADQKSYQVIVADGILNLELVARVGYPIISGIEVSSYVGVPPPPLQVDIESTSLRLYPNPVDRYLNLEFALGERDQVLEVEVYDQFMRRVYQESSELLPGFGKAELDLDHLSLSAGMYLIIVNTKAFPRQIGKIVKK